MVDQHPLTFYDIAEISKQRLITTELCDDMRAAADWQLEQVLKWLKNCRDYDLLYIRDRGSMRRELKKAMRPTQENKS